MGHKIKQSAHNIQPKIDEKEKECKMRLNVPERVDSTLISEDMAKRRKMYRNLS